MTADRFNELCQRATVPPELALEDDALVAALLANDDDEVARILEEEF